MVNGFSLRVRGKILLLFVISAYLLLSAAAVSFWEFYGSLRVFEEDVTPRQANAISVEAPPR
jgi:CHASE3 domain sensor protein